MKEARSILIQMKHGSTKTSAMLRLDDNGAEIASLIAKLANSATLSYPAAEALTYLYIRTQDARVKVAIDSVLKSGSKRARRAMLAYMRAVNSGGPII